MPAMRALLAAGLALLLVLVTAGPHAHGGPHGEHDCAVCVVRGAAEATSATPDVAPVATAVEAPLLPPGLAPVTGAPLGAIPGQSPPAA